MDDQNLDAAEEQTVFSKERTDLSEDRTILSNERLFASWFRTGFASVGLGLGFQALFLRMQPEWVPRTIATAFLLLGIFLFVTAERRACDILKHLSAHHVHAVKTARLRFMAAFACAATVALIAAIWLLQLRPQ